MRIAKLILVLLPFCLATAGAQQQTPPPQQQQPFTIQVDTQLVVETVIVKDRDGKNIEGLTEKDFTVTEDNVPQTISVFQFQKLVDTPAPAPTAATAPRSGATPSFRFSLQLSSNRNAAAGRRVIESPAVGSVL
jgi:hypothetical protein